jgi:hypothetical protein
MMVYRDGLAIAERLAASDHNNMQWQRDLSISYDRGSLPDELTLVQPAITLQRLHSLAGLRGFELANVG